MSISLDKLEVEIVKDDLTFEFEFDLEWEKDDGYAIITDIKLLMLEITDEKGWTIFCGTPWNTDYKRDDFYIKFPEIKKAVLSFEEQYGPRWLQESRDAAAEHYADMRRDR